MHKQFNKFLQSVVVLPVLTASFVLNPAAGMAAKSPTAAAISPDQNRTLSTVLAANQQPATVAEAQPSVDIDADAAKVDVFFAEYGLPMQGDGKMLVQAAVDNGLPPYSVAGIALAESTGGRAACTDDSNNAFGWNSCHGPKFKSMQDAIDTVAATIAGNVPATASEYLGKSFTTRLEVYNGFANDMYVKNVDWAMNKMSSMQVEAPVQVATF